MSFCPQEPDFEKTALWLKALGAAEVLRDEGSFRVSAGRSPWLAALLASHMLRG